MLRKATLLLSFSLAPALLLVLAVAPATAGQDILAVDWDGNLWAADPSVGFLSPIDPTGIDSCRSLARDSEGTVYLASGNSIYELDVRTARASLVVSTNLGCIIGMAFSPGGDLFALTHIPHTGVNGYTEAIYTIDLSSGAARIICALGAALYLLQDIEFSNNGALYSVTHFGNVIEIDPATGSVDWCFQDQVRYSHSRSLARAPDGRLFSMCYGNLTTFDETSGQVQVVTDFVGRDVRGIAFVPEQPKKLALAIQSKRHAGGRSISVQTRYGLPHHQRFTCFVLAQRAAPGVDWFGIHPTLEELAYQVSLPMAPFNTVSDATGATFFAIMTAFELGLSIHAVTIEHENGEILQATLPVIFEM